MSVRYRKVQEKREGNKNYGKWYGRAVVLNNVTTKELAEEIAHRNLRRHARRAQRALCGAAPPPAQL